MRSYDMNAKASEWVNPLRRHVDELLAFEGRRIAQILAEGLGFEDAAHDFAGARLGQGWHKRDGFGFGDGAEFFGHMGAQFLAEFVAAVDASPQNHEAVDAGTFDFVGQADGRSFGDGGMRDQGTFDFGGTQTIARDLDDVVDAANHPEVAVFVATG